MSLYSPGIAQSALIQIWIAEVLVVADGTLSDEQVAPGCLDKLVDRNIIELVMTLGAEAASCKVHGCRPGNKVYRFAQVGTRIAGLGAAS